VGEEGTVNQKEQKRPVNLRETEEEREQSCEPKWDEKEVDEKKATNGKECFGQIEMGKGKCGAAFSAYEKPIPRLYHVNMPVIFAVMSIKRRKKTRIFIHGTSPGAFREL
jgi:hypothetical protein